ncbi:MAG: BspA family leucine-rich repeat surface protein [Clostridia bacterium]|nr:BspA family leucine-rich repeat surface protein [Clostridia bacterium]
MKRIVKILLFTLTICLFAALFTSAALAESKPWAVYNDTEKTLTFCVGEKSDAGVVRDDTENALISGDAYYTDFLNLPYYQSPRWLTHSSSVTKAVFLDPLYPTSTRQWFYMFQNLSEIEGINNLNTSAVKDMYCMFYYCSSLTSLDLHSFGTANVTTMQNMFAFCSNLTSLDLSSFNTENVVHMGSMFMYCSLLSSLNITGFHTEKVSNMYSMFDGCSALTSLDLHHFNTSNVTDMAQMFSGCSSLTSLDVSSFDVSKITSMSSMFSRCSSLTRLDLRSFHPAKNTSLYWTFSSCSGLTELLFDQFDTGSVLDMTGTFSGCRSLTSLDVSSFNTSRVKTMAAMFNSCSALRSIDVSGFDTSSVSSMGSMFCSCSCLTTVDVSRFNTANVTDMSGMFYFCTNLQSVNVSGFNTSQVTSMREMFIACYSLTELDVSRFDTSNVTNMYSMFTYCYLVPELDCSHFNTEKVTDMTDMFFDCRSLQTLDVSSFNTSNVTNMFGMFAGCYLLESLDVSGFDTSNVVNMGQMFHGCSKLSELDVSHFNTEKTVFMDTMFYNCSGLQLLDLSNFDTRNISDQNLTMLLGGCCLSTIILGENTKLSSRGSLNSPSWTFPYTGYWVKECGDGTKYTANQLMTQYDGATMSGTWVWEKVPLDTYAVYNDTEKTLTFVVGRKNDSGVLREEDETFVSGDAFRVILDDPNAWFPSWLSCGESVTRVVFLDSIAPKSTAMWFHEFRKLTEINGLEKLNTSSVVDMGQMFYRCSSLTSLDVSSFDTAMARRMEGMFSGCSKLQTLDLSHFDTSNVSVMSTMFYACNSLKTLDVSNFNTSKVGSFSYMFAECYNLTELDVSGFDTSKATKMDNMFRQCQKLRGLDVSGFDTSLVTDMSHMFLSCKELRSLDVSSFDTGKVTTLFEMFCKCSNLTKLDLSNFDTSNVTNMTQMLYGDSLLELKIGSKFSFISNTAKLCEATNATPYTGYWIMQGGDGTRYTANQLMISYDGSTMAGTWVWEKSPVAVYDETAKTLTFVAGDLTDAGVVRADETIVSGDNYYTGFLFGAVPWSEKAANVSEVIFMDTIVPTTTANWFSDFMSLTDLTDMENLNTTQITSTSGMFKNCRSLTELDLSGFDTENVTGMDEMFEGCTNLSEITLGEDFAFLSTAADLTEADDTFPLSGYWIYQGGDGTRYTAGQLMETYNGETMNGTWVWERLSTDLENAQITPIEAQIYTQSPIEPILTVTMYERELIPDTDYTVSYENNTDIGDAAIATISGIGLYEGTQTVYFTIYCAHGTLNEAVKENEVLPTCLTGGSYEWVTTCALCGEEMTREKATVDPLGHDLTQHEGKAPTCTEDGWEAYETCSRCDYTTYHKLSKLGHNYGDWNVVRAASEEGPGLKERTCSRCGETQEKEIKYTISIWQKLIEFFKMLINKLRSVC